MSSYPDEQGANELRVTFYPPLFLQRRIWILEALRAETATQVLDVGCGEGQLLSVLCQPAPWLPSPPRHILPPSTQNPNSFPPSPTYDEIPDLHLACLYGLDICQEDLEFAIHGTAFRGNTPNENSSYRLTNVPLRWENLEVKIWKGGLEVINDLFVDIECIVSTEVIEHLPPDIFPAFAPMLLGVYHPRLLLVTTPSYTFNARFTAPNAPPSARKGYRDPTKRTDRIFRHEDHKFEWTADEFQMWCEEVAYEWGYSVQVSSIGRAVEVDEWGRDEELGGASLVAIFKKLEMENREQKARAVLKELQIEHEPHKLLTMHKMEYFREAFMRVEELWFEQDIAMLCGGWIEMLVKAVEESEFLMLKRDGQDGKNDRGNWMIELIGGVAHQRELWPADGEKGYDHVPSDWFPEEEEVESSEGGWNDSTDMEGDISWAGSEDDEDKETVASWTSPDAAWGTVDAWGLPEYGMETIRWREDECDMNKMDHSSAGSVTGWDGDASDDTN